MDGILLVDKPRGWTSHDVCRFVKKRFRLSKVGHAGTLDPYATGLLVLLIGRLTKSSQYFSFQTKAYEGTMVLGAKTDTHDLEGKVIARASFDKVTDEAIRGIFQSFTGQREQLPPMASAIKFNGVALYRLFRRGEEIERKPRQITVHKFEPLKVRLPYVDFSCTVSKGTYVRTLVNDMGEELGSFAYIESLRRTSSGSFSVADSVTVDALKALPSGEALKGYFRKFSHEGIYAPSA